MKISLPSPTSLNKRKECSCITSPLPQKGGLEKVNHLFSIRNFQFLIVLLVFLFSGCATWYQRTAEFQAAVNSGNFEKANKLLDKDKKQATGKNRILYYLNKGYVEFMLGNPTNSNQYFETAENLIDEYHSNVGAEAAALVTNPEARPYRPEDFEVIMINFYKALNYIDLNDMEGALVEVRKINIKLNQLNDKYPDNKNRYQRDAFAHLLMGLIYDATGDYNNAFIAYRNAYEVYQSDYIKNFGVKTPEQLKQDLMRTAYNCGFTAELKQYEKEFNTTYTHTPTPADGQLVFFWLNGMGPVKAEWSINFVKQKRGDGAIVFHNESLGLTFPFFFGSGYSDDEKQSIANLQTLRVAFPKYMERPPLYATGTLVSDNHSYPLELAENINEIAFKTLRDRMVREFSNSLLRVAAKKGLEYSARKQNEWLGFAVGIANSLTEKADTRNWQTLPYSISYTRLPLSAGTNNLTLRLNARNGSQHTEQFSIEGGGRKTRFHVFQTMDSRQ